VLFGIASTGKGVIKGRELDCGSKCEHRYVFGTREELRALPGKGWRFFTWSGACGRAATCSVYVGPRTIVGALFVENLEPKLLSVKTTGTKAARKVTVRLSVRHEGTARLKLLRDAPTRVFTDRRFPLTKGVNAVALPVPVKVKAGRLRLLVATSDGSGGGRTFTRVVKVGP
jgi:hypothetical protein